MKATPAKVIQLMVLLFAIILQFSCSKDTDLLADYVTSDAQASLFVANLAIDDYFVVAKDSEIVLDVLSNDSYEDPDNVKIVDVTQPENGIVIVNEDKTVTYIPNNIDTPSESSATPTESTDTAESETPQENNTPETTNAPEESADSDESVEESSTDEYSESPQQKETFNENQAPEVNETPEETTVSEEDATQENQNPTEEEESALESFSYTAETVNEDLTTETTEAKVIVKTESENASNIISYQVDYYVTTDGTVYNNGRTEATAWSIERAFKTAKAGDVVAIKAGNYGNKNLVVANSGTKDNPIRFIGYTDTPGDLVSSKGSTFNYGNQLDSRKMPLLRGSLQPEKMAIAVRKNYVELHNFQITGYELGVIIRGNNVLLKNIITYETGPQTVNSGSGKGIILYGNNGTIMDCFDYNSTSQGITLGGSKDSKIDYCQVYSDNKINPGGYYILLAGGTENSIVDHSVVYRDKDADIHRGHGFILKDRAIHNTIRNSFSYNTGIEVNFSGVYSNTFENVTINGSYSSDDTEFSSNIRVINGAHDNTFKNIYINDCRYAINFHDFDDGFVGSVGNLDAAEGGSNNKFINLVVKNAKNIIGATSAEAGLLAFSNNNEFTGCTFKNITMAPFFSYQTMKNTEFVNCSFFDIPSKVMTKEYKGGSLPIKFETCTFTQVGFPIPH